MKNKELRLMLKKANIENVNEELMKIQGSEIEFLNEDFLDFLKGRRATPGGQVGPSKRTIVNCYESFALYRQALLNFVILITNVSFNFMRKDDANYFLT